MFTRNRSIALGVFTIVALMGIGWVVGSGHVQATAGDYYENMTLLQQVAAQIRVKYVDDIDAGEAVDAAIHGMLDTLDPYTEFLEKKRNDEMKMMQIQGRYGGLGIKITKRDQALEVVGLFDDTPAYNAGIQTGDRIVRIEGQSTAGFDVSQAADLLRGEPGTSVHITVARDGDDEIGYAITRAVITIPVVQYTGVIQDHIGYIKLNQFTEDAGIEVERSLKRLKAQGVDGVILDLRGNPGGLLEQAVAVAGKFLKKGSRVVYTRGRDAEQNKEYHASSAFVMRNRPLAVLVDEYSASASEIVAGAIQDWDRGVVVGTTTYGKALVQQIFPMSNGAALKITTARYYTPSGRLIQKIRRSRRHPETLKKIKEEKAGAPREAFHTQAGRVVYGGGGITPDFVVEPPEYPQLVASLIEHRMFVKFAAHYIAAHEPAAHRLHREAFQVDETMVEVFRAFLAQKRFTYRSAAEMELDRLEKMGRKQRFTPPILQTMTTLRNQLHRRHDVEFAATRKLIEARIGTEIAAKLWGSEGRYSYAVRHDPQVLAAIGILKDQRKYHRQLSAPHAAGMDRTGMITP